MLLASCTHVFFLAQEWLLSVWVCVVLLPSNIWLDQEALWKPYVTISSRKKTLYVCSSRETSSVVRARCILFIPTCSFSWRQKQVMHFLRKCRLAVVNNPIGFERSLNSFLAVHHTWRRVGWTLWRQISQMTWTQVALLELRAWRKLFAFLEDFLDKAMEEVAAAVFVGDVASHDDVNGEEPFACLDNPFRNAILGESNTQAVLPQRHFDVMLSFEDIVNVRLEKRK